MLRSSPFWGVESSEALHRTAIDLTLFERLSAHQENGARKLCVKAERTVAAESLTGKIVSGDVDYPFVRRGFGPPGSHHSKSIQHSSESIYGRDERSNLANHNNHPLLKLPEITLQRKTHSNQFAASENYRKDKSGA
jgi:hypothetical protein